MTDIVSRMREHVRVTPERVSGVGLIAEAADVIAQLRADLLQAEMQAEMAGLENIMRAAARGRREGIEAALPLLAASDEVLSGLARGECEQFMYAKFAPVVGAFRALLEDGR